MANSDQEVMNALDKDQKTPREWRLIENLVMESIKEKRSARYWTIFFRLLSFLFLFYLLFFSKSCNELGKTQSNTLGGDQVALIDIDGVIADKTPASADMIIEGLQDAFEDKNTKAVILRINSPGGSPVQAGYVYDEIKRLRAQYPNIKLYAIIQDMGASGAYYIASAADEIYADKASLVGSIGVLMSGFGFVGAMEKLGVERRLMTAGEHKGFLDPFSPQNAQDNAYMQEILNTVHAQFIQKVKEGRGKRLKDDPVIFSGLAWSGEQAVKLGLVDGLGSASYVARDIVKVDNIVDFTKEETPFERFARSMGSSMANVILSYWANQPLH
jgi:protease-4